MVEGVAIQRRDGLVHTQQFGANHHDQSLAGGEGFGELAFGPHRAGLEHLLGNHPIALVKLDRERTFHAAETDIGQDR